MLILTTGRFGGTTARLLLEKVPAVHLEITSSGLPALDTLTSHEIVVVILWRPDDALCESVDDACWQAEIPWWVTWLLDGTLVCGPLIRPGHGPCYECFRRRYRTHQRGRDRHQAVEQAYRQHPEAPPGFTSVSTWLAATAATQAVNGRNDATAVGRLCLVDLLDGSVLETRVVPVHGCARCGSPRGTDRFVRRLGPEVEELLA